MYYDKNMNKISVVDWVRMFANDDMNLAVDNVEGTMISTVFTGLDMAVEDEPVLWETMVFSDDERIAGEMRRWSTEEQALSGHKQMTQWVRDTLLKTSTQEAGQ